MFLDAVVGLPIAAPTPQRFEHQTKELTPTRKGALDVRILILLICRVGRFTQSETSQNPRPILGALVDATLFRANQEKMAVVTVRVEVKALVGVAIRPSWRDEFGPTWRPFGDDRSREPWVLCTLTHGTQIKHVHTKMEGRGVFYIYIFTHIIFTCSICFVEPSLYEKPTLTSHQVKK